MNIEYKTGNILQSHAEALVNPVNCVGVMGAGLALQFKKAYPDNFRAYAEACARKEMQPGNIFVFETHEQECPQFIINFPTKRHWKDKSRLEDIQSGLTALAAEIRKRRIGSIAIPPVGCGLGGLSWSDVRPRINDALIGLDGVRVIVLEPPA